jgi:hypothetical protein
MCSVVLIGIESTVPCTGGECVLCGGRRARGASGRDPESGRPDARSAVLGLSLLLETAPIFYFPRDSSLSPRLLLVPRRSLVTPPSPHAYSSCHAARLFPSTRDSPLLRLRRTVLRDSSLLRLTRSCRRWVSWLSRLLLMRLLPSSIPARHGFS